MKTLDKEILKIGYNVIVTLRDALTGEIKEQRKIHNTICTVGKAAIANWLSNVSPTPATLYVNKVALGTNAAAPAAADTKLGTETYRNSVASETNASAVAYITGFFGATECSGSYKEAGLFIAGTAAADSGTLLSHVAINITKTTSDTLTIDWVITIA
jgi:hypothetical protein